MSSVFNTSLVYQLSLILALFNDLARWALPSVQPPNNMTCEKIQHPLRSSVFFVSHNLEMICVVCLLWTSDHEECTVTKTFTEQYFKHLYECNFYWIRYVQWTFQGPLSEARDLNWFPVLFTTINKFTSVKDIRQFQLPRRLKIENVSLFIFERFHILVGKPLMIT